MTTTTPAVASSPAQISPEPSPGSAPGMEQLSLLSTPAVPLQFRLDERTRRAGLQHVAELRAMMAAQAAGRRSGTGARGGERTTTAPQRSVAA